MLEVMPVYKAEKTLLQWLRTNGVNVELLLLMLLLEDLHLHPFKGLV